MLIEMASGRTLDEIGQALAESAARHKFGVLTVHDLKATLAGKGIELGQDCRVYEVCQPQQAKRVLDASGAISTALPCRISVYGHPGRYTLATLQPTALLTMFAAEGVSEVAAQVEADLTQMMRDAAGQA